MDPERRCWKCETLMALMVEDGVERWVCPDCGPRLRAPRHIGRQTRRRGVVTIYRGRSGRV